MVDLFKQRPCRTPRVSSHCEGIRERCKMDACGGTAHDFTVRPPTESDLKTIAPWSEFAAWGGHTERMSTPAARWRSRSCEYHHRARLHVIAALQVFRRVNETFPPIPAVR